MSFPFPISQSQIGCARMCWRKYGWEYIEKVESEPSEAMAIGIEMHEHLERWFKEGTPPPDTTQAGRMAIASLHHWPIPATIDPKNVECHLEVETEHGWYHGYADIEYFDVELGVWVVGDHKSTSDHKWAKQGDALRLDPQAVIYSAATMVKRNVDVVANKWVYTTRVKPKSLPVIQAMTRADVEAGFDSLDETARDIYYVRSIEGLRALDLPPNPNACGAYGGCAHIERCNLTAQEKMRALMSQQTLREKILANKQAKAAGQEVAKPAGQVTQLRPTGTGNTTPATAPTPAVAPTAAAPAKAAQPLASRPLQKKAAPSAAELSRQYNERLAREAKEREEEEKRKAAAAPAPTVGPDDDESDEDESDELDEDDDSEDMIEAATPAEDKQPGPVSPTAATVPAPSFGPPAAFVAKFVSQGADGTLTYRIEELGHSFTVRYGFSLVAQ